MSSRSPGGLACLTPRPGDDADELVPSGFLEPRHLCGLVATAHRLRAAGRAVRLVLDPASPAASYAARMRLGAVLATLGVEHDLPVVRERRVGDRLLEVTALRTPDDVLHLAGLVGRRLRARGAGPAAAVSEAVTELGMNVPDHADPRVDHAPAPGWVAAQTMPATGEVVFAIADAGVGMLATLRPRGAEDDLHAVHLALGGTSRFAGSPERGLGLHSIDALVTGLGGRLDVVTGTASLTSRPRGRTTRRLDTAFGGTLLQGRVPMGG